MNDTTNYDVAIVGISCRVPDADNANEFWNNLVSGKECISFFSKDEMLKSGESEEKINKSGYINAGAVINDIDKFDNVFFDIPKWEAELTDPQHRIFLENVWSALEDSGNIPGKYKGLVGVFGSVSTNTYQLYNLSRNNEVVNNTSVHSMIMGNEKDFLCTRASYKLDLKGPSMTVQTACSSSLVALHMAVQSILNYECDMAVAGGVTVRSNQKGGYLYQDGGILSSDGFCRAFDDRAKGTIGGNGVGVVVLKRYDDALRDGDHIYAKVIGSAVNNDGINKVGYTAPGVDGQMKVISEALELSGISPEQIEYIETHGTGTQLGDPVEISALTKVFRKKTSNNGFCAIGSVKSSIGHLDVASGIVGLIKVALMLKHKKLVPMANFSSPNRKLGLENSPFYISNTYEDWESQGIRRAGVSSFGLGGTNCHVVLEEHIEEAKENNKASLHIVPISAKSDLALRSFMKTLYKYIETTTDSLDEIAYTLSMGRKEFDKRCVFVCKDIADLKEKLIKNNAIEAVSNEQPKLSFKISEITVEYAINILKLKTTRQMFNKNIELCSDILKKKYGFSLDELVNFSIIKDRIGSIKFDLKNVNKVLSFIAGYALANELLLNCGIKMDSVLVDNFGGCILAAITMDINLEDTISYILENGVFDYIEEYSYKKLDVNICKNIDTLPDGYIVNIGSGELIGRNENTIFNVCTKVETENEDIVYQNILSMLGILWSKGLAVDWKQLYSGRTVKKVSLPTYCFDRKRHWIEPSPALSQVDFARQHNNTKEQKLSEKEVSEKVKEIWCKFINIEELKEDDDFFYIGGDSFKAIQVNACYESIFGVKIPINKLLQEPTIKMQVKNILIELEKENSTNSEINDNLIMLKKGKESKAPVFLIHAAGGNIMSYKPLVKYLELERDIYGIQYDFNNVNEDKAFETIEETARRYIKMIKAIYPNGAYVLAGHSYGGNLAFEMTLQMEKENDNIESLIMFDSHPPASYLENYVVDEDEFYETFPLMLELLLDNKVEVKAIEIKENMPKKSSNKKDRMDDIIEYLKKLPQIFGNTSEDEIRKFMRIWMENHNALKAHKPKDKYSGKLIYFRAKIMQNKKILDTLNINLEEGMDVVEWGKLVDSIELYEIPASHYSILNEPYVEGIAKTLNDILKN